MAYESNVGWCLGDVLILWPNEVRSACYLVYIFFMLPACDNNKLALKCLAKKDIGYDQAESIRETLFWRPSPQKSV